jgi:hypothetical protein
MLTGSELFRHHLVMARLIHNYNEHVAHDRTCKVGPEHQGNSELCDSGSYHMLELYGYDSLMSNTISARCYRSHCLSSQTYGLLKGVGGIGEGMCF